MVVRIGGALAFVLLTFLIPSDSWAQRQRGNSPNVWGFLVEKYDKNKDGELSKSEYDRADNFSKFDTNKDGVLTKDDWSGTPARRGPRSRGNSIQPPTAGDVAPDFELTSITNADQKVRLSSFVGKKPVALIFGSCT